MIIVGLAEAIEIGDKVRFETNPLGYSVFGPDRVGTLSANNIEPLGK